MDGGGGKAPPGMTDESSEEEEDREEEEDPTLSAIKYGFEDDQNEGEVGTFSKNNEFVIPY